MTQVRLEGRHSTLVTDSGTFSAQEASDENLGDLLVASPEGSSIGQLSALEALDWGAMRQINDEEDEQVQAKG